MKHRKKQEIIKRLILVPTINKRAFWSKEIKFLNDLIKIFPNEGFWDKVKFSKQYDSLLFLKSKYGLSLVVKKFLEFSYKPKPKETIKLGEKTGKDYVANKKPKTIKDFLS